MPREFRFGPFPSNSTWWPLAHKCSFQVRIKLYKCKAMHRLISQNCLFMSLIRDDETGRLKDLRFLDLQFLRISEAAKDINYLLWTSSSSYFGGNCLEQLLQEYYQARFHLLLLAIFMFPFCRFWSKKPKRLDKKISRSNFHFLLFKIPTKSCCLLGSLWAVFM